MGVQLLLLAFELVCCRLLRTNVLMAIFSALNTLSIASMLYTGFYSLGCLAYLFVLIAHSPYIIALARLGWRRESEHRRRVLYEVCQRLYLMQMTIDLWMTVNLYPDIET